MRSHAAMSCGEPIRSPGRRRRPRWQVDTVSRDDTPVSDPFYPPQGGVVERIEIAK